MLGDNDATANENKLNYKLVAIATAVSLLNSFCYDSFIIMMALVIIESVFLISCLVRKQYFTYIIYYTIFLSTSLESPNFVGEDVFYGFKSFKIAGVNLGVVFLMLIFLVLVANGSINKIFNIKGNIRRFAKGAAALTIIGFTMGLIELFVNDNDIGIYDIKISMFVDACYMFLFVALEIIVIVTIIEYYGRITSPIKQGLTTIVISLAVTLIMSLLLENYGNRGGVPSLQVSNLIMLLSCAVLLSVYPVYGKKEKMAIAASGTVIVVLGLIYNANGKMIIIAMLLPILTIIVLYINKKYKTAFAVVFLSILIIVFSSNALVVDLSNRSALLEIKTEQVASMLSFWEVGWFDNMPDSPRIRIAQFMNITYEYYNKPWLFLTGKGYMGTIKDHMEIFGKANEFTYSIWELDHGLYYVMHETFNTLYLTNGLLGILFFFQTLKVILSKFTRTPWLIIGGFWFALFYAYSVTISIFGVTAFIVGLYDVDKLDGLKIRNGKPERACRTAE